MSITTWMVVLLCAGSTPILCRPKGRTAPRQTDERTMTPSASVTATVSGSGVWNATARTKPAIEIIEDSATAMRSSRYKNLPRVSGLSVPSARPLT